MMEILLMVNLVAILSALCFIAYEVRKVSDGVVKIAQMEDQTQRLILRQIAEPRS